MLNTDILWVAERENSDNSEFRKFRRNLFHGSLRYILNSLQWGMMDAEIIQYGDGYFRRTIWGLGPYIADYPEQVLISCIVQNWCPS